MPVISITLLPVYPDAVEQRLLHRVATAARSVIAASPAGTTVFTQHAGNYQRNGQVFHAGAPARAVASEVVKGYLEAMQERDLPAAQAFLADGFTMCFPGGVQMQTLQQMMQWARPRYRSIAKDYENFEEVWREEDCVVYCHGTLHGIFNDGSAFSGVRFIDRFEVCNDRIVRQDVWNDLAQRMSSQAAA